MFHGKRHFRELLAGYEKIAPNILSSRRNKLQEWGIIKKVPGPNKRSPHGFKLTEDGVELAPILLEMLLWGSRFLGEEENPFPQEQLARIQENKDLVLKHIRDQHLDPTTESV